MGFACIEIGSRAGQDMRLGTNGGNEKAALVRRLGVLRWSHFAAGAFFVFQGGGGHCQAIYFQTGTYPTAPNTWKKVVLDDGAVGYVPVWK